VSDVVKSKISQLYQFLKAANQLNYRPIRLLSDHPRVIRLADMPDHPALQLLRPVGENDGQSLEIGTLLRIRRPALTPCPKPPEAVLSWLLKNWDDPAKPVTLAESQNAVVTQQFGDEPARVSDFTAWLDARETADEQDGVLVPPDSILPWLVEGWDKDAYETPQVIKQREVTITVRFQDDVQRVIQYRQWLEQRTAWVPPELAAHQAMGFYERFYDIYAALQKDSEGLELVVADGHLQWQAASELDGAVQINHPLLFKRVELAFNPQVPEFLVMETERAPEFYANLFLDLKDILPSSIRSRHHELEEAGYHPLGWDDTTAFLKAVIQTISPTSGQFLEQPPTGPISGTPRLFRDMALLLRARSTGLANAISAIVEDIGTREVFPPALAQITGTVDQWDAEAWGQSDGRNAGRRPAPEVGRTAGDDDILLAKEANNEQMQILRKLDSSGSVLVQGPPGTGKTHTIGNVVSHLLAQGKSILVTAHTTKALRVVRDKIPEMLRPLAVSVLGSDQTARQQLEASIGAISERMTADSADSLLAKAQLIQAQRLDLLAQRKTLTQTMRRALENEYREIRVGGVVFSPSDAARHVREHAAAHSWLPTPVKVGADLTLSPQEIEHLYYLGKQFSTQEEHDSRQPLPDLEVLPDERQFKRMVSEYQGLITTDLSAGTECWSSRPSTASESLAQLAGDLASEFSDELRRQSWRPYAIVAGIHGATERMIWEALIEHITHAAEAQSQNALVLHHKPRLSSTLTVPDQRRISEEICDHVSNGGKLGFFQLATRSEWREFIKTTAVTAGQPNHIEHFKAIRARILLEEARAALQPHWDERIGQHIGQPFDSLGGAAEHACRALVPEIRRCLDWHDRVWQPLAKRLREEGLKLDELMASQPHVASEIRAYQLIETACATVLPPVLAKELGRRRLAECEFAFQSIERLAREADPRAGEQGCVGLLLRGLQQRHNETYLAGLHYARRLHIVKPLVVERDQLLAKLALVAPAWATEISERVSPHDAAAAPGEVLSAWQWRQLNDELAERDRLNADDLQQQIEKLENTLRAITLSLIDARAWGNQLDRLKKNNSVRQSLVGWLDTARKLVSTRKPEHRQSLLFEARNLMKRCAEAVPVWIMPISIVAENFDPRTTRFDVVIIDEASQADLNALIPLYLGKQVIIVGDHEQVTPLGVGKGQDMLVNLRKQLLENIPNSHLFDNKFSIYDIGRQAFGETIKLAEHFRCVPEIIGFSNQLSYEGKIRPLRESSSSDLKPACVSSYVDNGARDGDTNPVEARRVVDLIKAMIAHPRYTEKSIGVISMIGDKQAELIQSLIHREIPDTEIVKRRIVAGNSSEFQGDERDVVLLSMVDSPTREGPMRLTGEGAFESNKKRFNVASSRARDQLFVVHSFDPDLHLQAADLRMRLLQHVRDPLATLRAYHSAVGKTESPFERAVLKILTDAGYRVVPQWEVGYYRIDMVVEGGGKRLAVECDGDRYHPMDKLAADMERQTILERLGWQFVRIRGSAFYRDADAAMRPVFARLLEMAISKEADRDLPDPANNSLIHELDDLIRRRFVPSDELNDITETEHEKSGGYEPTGETAGLDGIPPKPDGPESLLRQMGGLATLEGFLREYALLRGHTRLGKQIREQLTEELHRLVSHSKAMAITNGVIQLL
jgi:superfamily I DNA/RNA helicase/very-short-patch-repair endonuclease